MSDASADSQMGSHDIPERADGAAVPADHVAAAEAAAHAAAAREAAAARVAAEERACELRPGGGSPDEPLRIGVLLSGSGTNLQAIIDRIADGSLNARIELVVSSRPSAYGLKRAEAAGIQTLTLSKEIYADPMVADEVIAAELVRHHVDYVIMAGYMRMVHAPLLATFPNRVVNLHPALLPSFPGAHAIAEAYARGVKVTGVTVHFANDLYDSGPIIAQRALTVEEGWSVEELEEEIHKIEHVLYPEVIQLLAEGRVHVEADGRVSIVAAAGE